MSSPTAAASSSNGSSIHPEKIACNGNGSSEKTSCNSVSQPAWNDWEKHVGETMITAKQIADKLEELADLIAAKHKNDMRPLVIVPILKGGVFPGVELMKHLGERGVACRIDFLWFESYAGTMSTGTVKKLADLQTDIKGENVLLVDDLIDTGLTLAEAHKTIISRKPAKVEICVLLQKMEVPRHPSAVHLAPEYIGFQIPPKFIIGAFMDFKEHFRSKGDIVIFKKGEQSHLCDVGIVSQRPTPFQRNQAEERDLKVLGKDCPVSETDGERARSRSRSKGRAGVAKA